MRSGIMGESKEPSGKTILLQHSNLVELASAVLNVAAFDGVLSCCCSDGAVILVLLELLHSFPQRPSASHKGGLDCDKS